MQHVFAVTSTELTDLFYTEAFSGSWAIFSKFNWLGALMQFIISAFCLIGIFLTMYQLLVTMLYLSSRTLFDRIHELKQAGKGGKALGLPNLFKDSIATANNGTGLDAILSFLLSLLPDVKAYSDYNEGQRSYNLQDDDTITTYILKKALPTIMIVFFFAMGFNGTLFRAYGMVVDAMATAAEEVVSTDLTATVSKWMNSGKAYNFAYSADGTNYGELRQNIASSMYNKTLAKTDDLSTNAKLYIGQQIESWINNNTDISEGSNKVGSAEVPGFAGTDADCANLQVSVVINGTQKINNTENSQELTGQGIAMSNFGITGDNANDYYMHVFITKKSSANETNYFSVDEDDATNATSSGGSSSNNSNKPASQIEVDE
jgi:hypothetical protein